MQQFVPYGLSNDCLSRFLLKHGVHSSSVCRLSAVGLGWDVAFGSVNEMGRIDSKSKGWVEIDNAGQIEPVWEAFELFR